MSRVHRQKNRASLYLVDDFVYSVNDIANFFRRFLRLGRQKQRRRADELAGAETAAPAAASSPNYLNVMPLQRALGIKLVEKGLRGSDGCLRPGMEP